MKKIVALIVLLALVATVPVDAAQGAAKRGGFMGFIAGCCFGIRAAGDYNSGKEIHWREWGLLIPLVGIAISIMNGIDGANGVSKEDLAASYGAVFY